VTVIGSPPGVGVYVDKFPVPRHVWGETGLLKYTLLRTSFVAACKAFPTSVVDLPAVSVTLADFKPTELYDNRPPTTRLTVVMKINARIREAPSSCAKLRPRDVMMLSSCPEV
jgi:hypothetical protein